MVAVGDAQVGGDDSHYLFAGTLAGIRGDTEYLLRGGVVVLRDVHAFPANSMRCQWNSRASGSAPLSLVSLSTHTDAMAEHEVVSELPDNPDSGVG
ncbi:hypothetical protein [Nocardia sp. NPDC049707]|uniref:hypothetical protein n=1 Tax=Nocardia sp. NPDC049707 TaxID=3154735 RepID=UPI0034425425